MLRQRTQNDCHSESDVINDVGDETADDRRFFKKLREGGKNDFSFAAETDQD